MRDKRNIFYMLIFILIYVFTIVNRFKIQKIEKSLYDIKEKNRGLYGEIEDIKDEICSVYSHLEEISNLELKEI